MFMRCVSELVIESREVGGSFYCDQTLAQLAQLAQNDCKLCTGDRLADV